jgi:threonyl-tRNA synthetase
MVHRSIVGSLERVMAHLIEQHGGAFPAWLAPVQVAVLPVGEEEVGAARAFQELCVELDLRAEVVYPERGSLWARIRDVRLAPYQAVIGGREAADGAVAIRLRDGRKPAPLGVAEAAKRIAERVAARGQELWVE